MRQPYREGHEDQLAALGLVVNAVALWNTRYLSACRRPAPRPGRPSQGRGRRPASATPSATPTSTSGAAYAITASAPARPSAARRSPRPAHYSPGVVHPSGIGLAAWRCDLFR
ncbi:hypothetical protein AB0O34_19585 [Sphaerisporangium sp. NPDC088356]|uniref:hypothetical protein n=1 Tax=Sphaerisporangium sp. NPDC088356 TaxID=3154871 RepID=UPI003424941E